MKVEIAKVCNCRRKLSLAAKVCNCRQKQRWRLLKRVAENDGPVEVAKVCNCCRKRGWRLLKCTTAVENQGGGLKRVAVAEKEGGGCESV